MGATPAVRPALRFGVGHVLTGTTSQLRLGAAIVLFVAEEHKEWTRLRKAAHRYGRKFSKEHYVALLQSEDMDELRRNGIMLRLGQKHPAYSSLGKVDWHFVSRKFPGLPSITSSTGSDRSPDVSSDSSPSSSAENSPVDLDRARTFNFPVSNENLPPQGFTPIRSVHRKRLGQLAMLAALNDLRSPYADNGTLRSCSVLRTWWFS